MNTITNIDKRAILMRVTGKSLVEILTYDITLTKEMQIEYDKLIKLREINYPLAYILQNKEFMSLDFHVDDNVLIPRPETEQLVEEVLSCVQNDMRILDLCTGSGIIAICTKYYSKFQIKVDAVDISEKALSIAKKNSKTHNTQINFIKSDLFENVCEKYNIIVSNPPYLKDDEMNNLNAEVAYEPKLALEAGIYGLDFYEKIINQSINFLEPNGYLLFEIGATQANDISKLLQNDFINIVVIKDLANKDRIIKAQLKG